MPAAPAWNELIAAYAQGPELLSRSLQGMTTDQQRARPIPGKWSTHEVICHIADFEPVYVDRIKRVLAEPEPSFFSGDPDVFAAGLRYDARDIQDELALIAACRKHLAAILRTLTDADFARRGNHSENGPMTLEKLVRNVTGHIPHHIAFLNEKRAALGLPRV